MPRASGSRPSCKTYMTMAAARCRLQEVSVQSNPRRAERGRDNVVEP